MQTALKNIGSTGSNDFVVPLPSSLSLSFSPEKETYKLDRPLSPRDFATPNRPTVPNMKPAANTKGSKFNLKLLSREERILH